MTKNHPHDYAKSHKNDSESQNRQAGNDICEVTLQKSYWQRFWRFLDKRAIILITFIYTVFAGLQWHAMRESNRINREALISVQRAFVFATGINLYAPVSDANGAMAMAMAQIENAGATTATNLVIVANRQILPRPQNLGEHFDYPDAVPGTPTPRMLGPRETTISSITPMDPTCLDLLTRGKVRLFEWGRITYTDVFGAPHETDFCFFNVGAVVDYPQGLNKSIVFFPCAEHNCVDDACPKPEQRTKRTEWQDGDSICQDIALAEVDSRPASLPTTSETPVR